MTKLHEVEIIEPQVIGKDRGATRYIPVKRLRVPGGWLYKWYSHTTFVPDPENTEEITDKLSEK